MQELAEKTALSKQAISKYESGQMKPSSEVLIKLREALEVDVDYFFPKDESGLPIINLERVTLREKDKIDDNELEAIKKDTIDYLLRVLELEKIMDVKEEFKNPVADFEIRSAKDVEKAAKKVRKKWGLGNAPITNVVELLETNGIKVHNVERSEKFEGFSAWAGKIPIVVLNSLIKEATRIRFTALHELGHIVLEFVDELTEDDIENLCNAFSGELLFPSEVIVVEFGPNRSRFSIVELKHIKLKYGISIQAILLAARKAAILNRESYISCKAEYDTWFKAKADFGTYTLVETPQRFKQLLFSSLAEKKIPISKAAQLCRMKEGAFKKKFSTELFN